MLTCSKSTGMPSHSSKQAQQGGTNRLTVVVEENYFAQGHCSLSFHGKVSTVATTFSSQHPEQAHCTTLELSEQKE